MLHTMFLEDGNRMKKIVRRIFVEKKKGFDIEAQALLRDLRDNLGISGLKSVRIINRYDVEGISEEEYKAARRTIFSEPPVDVVYDENIEIDRDSRVIAVEYLPGQYDQRADSASQCIQILTCGERPPCRTAKLIVLDGDISGEEYDRVEKYCVNPVECRKASLEKPGTLDIKAPEPEEVKVLHGFTKMPDGELGGLLREMGLAMSFEDLRFCREYFRDKEGRDPTETEIRVLDTYWSDHCRHTTFHAAIEEAEFEDGPYSDVIKSAYEEYLASRRFVHGAGEDGGSGGGGAKDICLMDIATAAMKEMRKRGLLNDLEISDEINACSIAVNVDVGDRIEEWLVMFKNETHNHPTEIEPFGGAATCLGGAIRDPLSGRSYVYQAMRVTGSGDPRTRIQDTIPGKLPQKKITTLAAAGFSSYGNQVGLATGQVEEIYDPGYVAKRMEIGAVIGAAPRKNVVRGKPRPGNVVVLLGGRTGRDGCGGATGSSKAHTEESLETCGAEVQKGNPPTERKIQRLFRNPDVSRMIIKCNDFGAGGVSVAIGELAESLDINLDAVPKKYEGLDGTELAISESQERMAVMVDEKNVVAFIAAAGEENLEATPVAHVTDTGRLRMFWRGKAIVDISREFLNTNGVRQKTRVFVKSPESEAAYFKTLPRDISGKLGNVKEAWLANLQRLDVCSRRGLVERFDSTIGAGTVLMPFGGRRQLTPAEGMAAKIPVLEGDTGTATLMSFGYNPEIAKWSPFHGAVYAIVEACAKIAAMGGDFRKIRLTLQEYFEKPGKDPARWGKPFSALLGAYFAQMKLGIPAIGGKDSMSGTFKDMDVPPTLVAFAVSVADAGGVISPEFKKAGDRVILIPLNPDKNGLPDFKQMQLNLDAVHKLAKAGKASAACTVKAGGLAEAISKMCFGNMIGFEFEGELPPESLFAPGYGSVILELGEGPGEKAGKEAGKEAGEERVEEADACDFLNGVQYKFLGYTCKDESISVNGVRISLEEALEKWEEPLEKIFPVKAKAEAVGDEKPGRYYYCVGEGAESREGCPPGRDEAAGRRRAKPRILVARPRIFMPVFPGTNCEYDTERQFARAGGIVDTFVFKNLSSKDIERSVEAMAKKIADSQIIMIPGGFSAGDEPEGSGKFIAAVFRNPYIKEAVMKLINERDGLILGICNGFQALVKLGLLPYGEIRDMDQNSPTLTYNTIGRHVSRMVRIRVASNLSPWLAGMKPGDVFDVPVSHGEGRFAACGADLERMAANGQIATQYVDLDGNPTYDIRYNPNGSVEAIEGITSPDGRVFGKMGHTERLGSNVAKNVPGEKEMKIFEAGVRYFS